VGKGAKSLVDPVLFSAATAESNFISPHILIDVDHTMEVMKDETFGPVMGIMRVTSDQEAVTFMNQSEYALTASIWTRDTIEGERLGEDVECGTLFVNRCDYLDPALAWTGHKESGMGASLGEFGFDAFTLLKSFHIKEIQQ
jgi:acyl-CoA reductase-like NAD-dependent aldehyde dehydrogenase